MDENFEEYSYSRLELNYDTSVVHHEARNLEITNIRAAVNIFYLFSLSACWWIDINRKICLVMFDK
jgi:hypothetical protein